MPDYPLFLREKIYDIGSAQLTALRPHLDSLTECFGVPFEFGTISLSLFCPATLTHSRPLSVTAKSLRAPCPYTDDEFVVSGMNFLLESGAGVSLDAPAPVGTATSPTVFTWSEVGKITLP